MIRSLIARASGVAALRSWTEQRLKELGAAINAKTGAARRDAAAAAEKLVAGVRHDALRVDERTTELRTHVKELKERVVALKKREAALTERVAFVERWIAGTDAAVPLMRDVVRICDAMPAAIKQIQTTIRSAKLEVDPSPHVVVDEVLPNDVYDLLVETIPAPEFFEKLDRVKADFRPFGGPPAPPTSRLMWYSFDRELVEGAMKEALLYLFAPVIRDHYARLLGEGGAAEAAAAPMAARGRLMRRTPGYHLEPHLDPKRVLITGILYFARPQDSEEYGTSLFRINREFNASYMKTFYPKEHGLECDLVKTVKFRRNRLFAFINSGAAHGATIPADATQADRYAFQFYIKPQGATLNRLVGNAPPDRREQWGHLGATPDSPEDDY